MKLLAATYLLGAILYAPIFLGQSIPQRSEDSIPLSSEERLDTLVKYVRTQFYQNNYDRTIEIGEETLKLAKKMEDRNAIFRISSLMGNAFLQIDDTVQAKRIFFRTIQEAEKLNDTTRSLTTARIDLGNLYALQEKKKLAILTYKEALPLAEMLKDTTHLFILNYNIAELSLDMEDLIASEIYVAKTNLYGQNVTAKAYQAVAKLVTGRLHLLKQETEEAVLALDESIALAEASGYTDALIEGYEVGAQASIALENYQRATEYLLKADEFKSEKYKTDKIQALEMVTARFKINQYQQDLKAQELQNEIDRQQATRETTILWVKIALGILLVFSLILLYSYIRRKRLMKDLLKKNKQYLEAKEESEAQTQAKSRLFSNITHELRTPLYGIIGISSMLMEDKKLNHQEENLNSLKFSADYLLSLINNVLQYTKLNESKKRLSRNRFDLRHLIQKVVTSTKYLNTTQPNTYNVQIGDGIPNHIKGDDVKLAQVLMNLVSNSSKFTYDGVITIQAEMKEENDKKLCIEFAVEDTGVGISEERLGRIFTEFSETRSSYERQGAGLGLPIVKKLLERMGSKINIESEPGKGTIVRFCIWFEKTLQSTTKPVLNGNAHELFKGQRIVVVDDNKINLLVTQKTLEKYGATVFVANEGPEGIALAKQEVPNLILMDINMPGMNGFETTRRIKSEYNNIPVIALTAVEEEKILIDNEEKVFDDFLIKPYPQEEFVSMISKHLQCEKKTKKSLKNNKAKAK